MEWASISEEGVDTVIAYAATPDHDIDTYQSSKAVLADLATSTEVERTALKSTIEKTCSRNFVAIRFVPTVLQ